MCSNLMAVTHRKLVLFFVTLTAVYSGFSDTLSKGVCSKLQSDETQHEDPVFTAMKLHEKLISLSKSDS